MDSENWDPPPFVVAVKRPEVRREWAERVAAWCVANPELAAAWDEGLREDAVRSMLAKDRARHLAALMASGMPRRAVEAWEAGLQVSPAVDAAQAFLGSRKTFLLLMGSAGAGKTVATAEALKDGGLFVRAVELSRLSAYDAEDRARMERVHTSRLLVLDDLGAEMLHDGWRPMLDELVDVRYGARRPTIITTNLDSQTFKARYGERVADRIRHDGLVEKCGDKSRRVPTP